MSQLSFNLATLDPVPGQFSKRCRIIDEPALRHVLIDGEPAYVYPPEDKETQRGVVALLYHRKLATQKQLAKGFGVSLRSISNWVARFREEGLGGLSDKPRSGAPRRVTPEMEKRIFELRERRVKINDIATTLNLSISAVCRVLYSSDDNNTQCSLDILDDLNTSDDSNSEDSSDEGIDTPIEDEETELSNLELENGYNGVGNPWDRSMDRALARLGYIEDAEPLFPESQRIENAGIFLALASHSMNSFVAVAKKVYVSFGAAFYGIRSMFLILAMMALLRIKNSEQLGRYNPEKMGVILGLDRAPDVKTVRRKLGTLFLRQKACVFMDELVGSRLTDDALKSESELATIYVDGHSKSYYGKFKTGSTHLAARNRVDKAVTDYWVNQSDGTPLLVIPTAFNESMTKVLPEIIQDAKKMCHGKTDARLTVVFDRGGYSALLFERLISMDVDIITYNRGTIDPVDESLFINKKTIINNREYDYEPYCRETTLPVFETTIQQGKTVRVDTGRKVVLQEILIRRKSDDGITSILTTIKGQESIEIASRLFRRWSQENYFKYMKKEFALDHLCTYGTENIPADIDHPNPEYTKLTKDIAKQREIVGKICGKKAELFLENDYAKVKKELEKLKKSKNTKKLKKHLAQIEKLRKMKEGVKERVVASDFKQLKREGRLFSNVIKVASYYIETELVTLFKNNYADRTGNARSLVAAMLKCSGTIKTSNGKLMITLEKQATPLITRAAEELCKLLSERNVTYPGTKLILQFQIEKNRQR